MALQQDHATDGQEPTEILEHEHEVVGRVTDAMRIEAQRIRDGAVIDEPRLQSMVDFARSFTDGCHHAKEEKVLFVRLRQRSPAAQAPVSVMLSEHEQGRRLVAAIDEATKPAAAGDDAARDTLAASLSGYADLLDAHIQKENSVLFPLARRVFTREDRIWLTSEFERVEEEETGAGVHEKYHALAHQLAQTSSR
jgi:hemerythrin-like domain-containing protein